MKSFAVIILSIIAANHTCRAVLGALNLKIFKDPKDVIRKSFRPPCTTTSKTCEPPDIDLLEEQGFLQSEDGEDRCLLQHYFSGVCEGKYLEIGALDGIQSSTTYAFYKVLGWKGVNIEVDPDNFEDLQYNRRNDMANVHAAVCSESRTVHYAIGKGDNSRAVGGIWEFASDAHREQYWTNMTLYNTIEMKCTPVQSILNQVVGTRKFFFDLAIVDLEGAEFSALLGIDFGRISFGLIVVERNEDGNINHQVDDLLRSKGYTVSNVEKECGIRNVWYINQNFHGIYNQLS